MPERIAVVGLGYVGLPVALAFARRFPDVIGFDSHADRVLELRRAFDRNQEHPPQTLASSPLRLTSDPADLQGRTFLVVAVPTPVDHNNVPDLSAVERATVTVGQALSRGAVVVYESTVYPGVTDDICAPLLERESGLRRGIDCNDLRNSKVPDIHRELRQFGIEARVHNPAASAPEALHEYGIKLAALEEMNQLDALVLAVSHKQYLDLPVEQLTDTRRIERALHVEQQPALAQHPGGREAGRRERYLVAGAPRCSRSFRS